MTALRPAGLAFDAAAADFDARFGEWRSIAAQRLAVRRNLLRAFPTKGRILELGGGTGLDAAWLSHRGFRLLLTDISPAMVDIAGARLAPFDGEARQTALEDIELFADRHLNEGGTTFDGAFSNFAPLNCVAELAPVGRALARLLKPGASAMLVLFGTRSPGEVITETLCRRPRQAFRRLRLGSVAARLGGRQFHVTYHRGAALARAMHPWFRLAERRGIGIFVPPSAAEPWISRHPQLLSLLEKLDRLAECPLAALGDHILYHFERTEVAAP